MLAAYGLEPVAPMGGRSEEERGVSENSFRSRVRYAFSLSLVPVETFGVIQSSWSGLAGWDVRTGFNVVTERSFIY
jgi:hypothetical protein